MDNSISKTENEDTPVAPRDGYSINFMSYNGVIDSDGKIAPSFVKEGPNQPEVLLINRTFAGIDAAVSHKFLGVIVKKMMENPDRMTTVLDMGGGFKSRAAREIISHPYLKRRVNCINLDLFAHPLQAENLTVINSDFNECPIADESVDAVISYQALFYLNDEEFFNTLYQIARVLRKGGEAYLDIMGHHNAQRCVEMMENPSDPPNFPSWFKAKMSELGVAYYPTFGETKINGFSLPMPEYFYSMLHMSKADGNGKHNSPNQFSPYTQQIEEAILATRKFCHSKISDL